MATLTHDPVAAHCDALAPAAVDTVLGAMRAARDAAGQLTAPPPPWLHSRHAPLLGRVLHGLAVRRLALLAAPTGHGKTWIALAAHAMQHPDLPACVIAPAMLRAQWTAIATNLQLPIEVISHERVSRGPVALPPSQLIIVDEAHRFRTLTTRRHQHLADALAGQPVLLLTATPVVNRLDDLAALLQIGAPDDVLARDGIPSLQRLLACGDVHPALSRLVHVPDTAPVGPRLERTWMRLTLGPASRLALSQIDGLRFSRDPAVTALLRTTAEQSACARAARDRVRPRSESTRLDRAHAELQRGTSRPLPRRRPARRSALVRQVSATRLR